MDSFWMVCQGANASLAFRINLGLFLDALAGS